MTAGRHHGRTSAATVAFLNAMDELKRRGAEALLIGTGKIPLLVAAIRVLEDHYGETTRQKHATSALAELWTLFPGVCLQDITRDHLNIWNKTMKAAGNGPSTRLSKLSVVGVMCEHFDLDRPRLPKVSRPKRSTFWLTPELEAKVLALAAAHGHHELIDYITLVRYTGLRVREALRCQRKHFTGLGTEGRLILVPGTKTKMAATPLPLLPEAEPIILKRLGLDGDPEDYLFAGHPIYRTRRHHNGGPQPLRYNILQEAWRFIIRDELHISDSTATLKSLRRTFARWAADQGIPTEIIRLYLRHEQMATTEGYLRTVGQGDPERIRHAFEEVRGRHREDGSWTGQRESPARFPLRQAPSIGFTERDSASLPAAQARWNFHGSV